MSCTEFPVDEVEVLKEWQHSVLSKHVGLRHGASVENATPCLPTRGELWSDALIHKLAAMDRTLKLACAHEVVFSPDFFSSLPRNKKARRRVLDSIEDFECVYWLVLVGEDPTRTWDLPPNWADGYKNFAFAVVLHGREEVDRERIDTLKTIRCRHRAVILRRCADLQLLEPALAHVSWVLVDFHIGGEGDGYAADWLDELKNLCGRLNIRFFVPSMASGGGQVADGSGGDPHHPFQSKKINLIQKSPYAELLNRGGEKRRDCAAQEIQTDSGRLAPAVDPDAFYGQPDPVATVLTSAGGNSEPRIVVETVFMENAETQPPLVVDSENLNLQRFQTLDARVREGVRAGVEAAFFLLEIRNDELWRAAGYSTWNAYCATLLELTRGHVNRLIAHARITLELAEGAPPLDAGGLPILPTGESQTRPLHRLHDRKAKVKAWRQAVKRAGGPPTAIIVSEVVSKAAAVGEPPKPATKQITLLNDFLVSLDAAVAAESSWEEVRELVRLFRRSLTRRSLTR